MTNRWKNLKKTSSMDTGQIGYHDQSKQRRLRVEKDREIIKRLNKTKEEHHPDLAALQARAAAGVHAAAKKAQVATTSPSQTPRSAKGGRKPLGAMP